MRTKNNDPAARLAQEIIQFAKSNNLKIRKKSKAPTTNREKRTVRK